MSKVTFTKLGLTKDTSVQELEWNGQKIEIKNYLPIQEKTDLAQRVLIFAQDDNIFYNPGKVDLYETLEIILTYTNISITDKQSQDVTKLYDLFVSSGFAKAVKELIPQNELEYIHNIIETTIVEIYRYKNSFAGMVAQTQNTYVDLDQKVTELEERISNKDNLKLLKEVTEKFP